MENSQQNQKTIYYTGFTLIILVVMTIFLFHHPVFDQYRISMRIRVALSSLIYQKVANFHLKKFFLNNTPQMLRLSSHSLNQYGSGEIINLLTSDVGMFDALVHSLNYLLITPFHIILVGYFVWQEVGIVCLVGIFAIIILSFPLAGT